MANAAPIGHFVTESGRYAQMQSRLSRYDLQYWNAPSGDQKHAPSSGSKIHELSGIGA
jgi:hypothetical protein